MYKVYWTEKEKLHTAEQQKSWFEMTGETLELDATKDTVFSLDFSTSEMTGAMDHMEQLRKARKQGAPISFVGMVSEHPDSVGQAGVDSIKDGLCPDGVPYYWRKRRP